MQSISERHSERCFFIFLAIEHERELVHFFRERLTNALNVEVVTIGPIELDSTYHSFHYA